MPNIQNQIKKWNKKLIISFWSILHRNIDWYGDIPQISNQYWYDLIFINYPKNNFIQENINNIVIKFLNNNKQYKTIWLIGLSFGCVVGRNFLYFLESKKEYKKFYNKIKFFINLSGVSIYKHVKIPNILDNDIVIKTILQKPFSYITKTTIAFLWKIDKFINFKVSKKFIDETTKERDKNVLQKYLVNASLWLNFGLVERFKKMYKTKEIKKLKNNINIYSFYWTNDNLYKNPRNTANYILKNLSNIKKEENLIRIIDWWHAGLVEYPNKWDKPIENIIKDY